MDINSILIGLVAGTIVSFLIFKLINRSKNVSKTTFEELNVRFNETHTQLKVTEERLSNQRDEYAAMREKYEIKQKESVDLLTKSSSLETLLSGNENKISELKKNLEEQNRQNNIRQDEINRLKQHLAESKATIDSLGENLKDAKTTILKQEEINESLTIKNNKLNVENSVLSAGNLSVTEKLNTQKEEIIELQKRAHLQFEKIANQILEEKTDKFTATNKTNIEALLKPLGENIDIFRKKVEETYDKESKQRFSLEEKVKELMEQTNKVSAEANNLANALKGQTKKQGNWGEMILENILQKSGLVKNREYFLQQTLQNDDKKNLRPDVLVRLPDNRVIIIDSKVSMVAYDRFASAETTEGQSVHLNDHIKSIYNHIDDLSGKNYDNLDASLDFTMMFVPIEPAYLVAIQQDQNLWAYAYSKRILLISPTNLIACLKLMADLWKREMQSKNAKDIVKRGELLYEKFVGFVSTLEEVGKHLSRTRQSYDTAIGQLNGGSGHLIGQAMKLKNLGLKSSKEIPATMLPADYDPDEYDPVDPAEKQTDK